MKSFFFNKYSGAGNDFVLIDQRENPGFELTVDLIPHICDRRKGIGSDGVLYIKGSDDHDYSLDFYNPDGSTGMLCANGSRCSIEFAYKTGLSKGKSVEFLSNGKLYTGQYIKDGLSKLNLLPPVGIELNISFNFRESLLNLSVINTGSPYAVIEFQELKKSLGNNFLAGDLGSLPITDIAPYIRHSGIFEPDGVNVDFISVEGNSVNVRTFEKGVEAETLASGTGSVAAAIIANLKYEISPPIKVHTFGGDNMTVDFMRNQHGEFERVSLTGPVKLVYKGEYFI